MGRNISYPNQIAKIILELSTKYPLVNIGKHLDSISSDYGSLEWLSDKELYLHLKDYAEMLDEENPDLKAIMDDEETAKLIDDGTHLLDVAETDPEI